LQREIIVDTEDKYHLDRIKGGNKESFEAIFIKYYQNLCRYAFEILRSDDDSQDVVTEVFTNIWEKRGEINVNLSVASYLFRSVHNRSLNVIRGKKNKISSDYLSNSDKFQLVLQEGHKDFPLSGLIQGEKMELIKSAVNNLPNKCKQIFLMHRKFKLKYAEIADMLNISEHTVKAQVQIALQKLRAALYQTMESDFKKSKQKSNKKPPAI
jgi:RNA polymerase sigma-70 factor (family 1)